MNELRYFIQAIFQLFLPKPKRKKRAKRIEVKKMTMQSDELLLESGKPFRFSRLGSKRSIERRR